MNIHEYQAKEILAHYGVKMPRGKVAFSLPEAEEAGRLLGPGPYVLKAQVHAGGRGKGGGIRKVKDLAEIRKVGREMFGMNLVTPQTGPQGKPVSRLLVEEVVPVAREFYLGVTIDRRSGRVAILGSSEGGMEIEEVAARSPEKIHTMLMEPGCGFNFFQGRKLALGMGMEGAQIGEGAAAAYGLFRAFWEKDCSLAEINPLVLTARGNLEALDAKMNFDDSALYRHPEIAAMRDMGQEDSRDAEAARLGLHTYVNLNGNIGCIANGAGMGMATLDLLHYYGGEAANFLDAGAGTSKETIQNAFMLLMSNPRVKGILINMFGGITRCDTYAQGIVDALREKPLQVPLVVRMEGTNVELGRKILMDSGLNIVYANGMREAAQKVIELVRNA
jgi:succinyl-CoA synthetase beta subunit